MTNAEILTRIEALAGCQRNHTFRLAADFALAHQMTRFIETGCYRGIDADGQSTVILALLAEHTHGWATSYEIDQNHLQLAKQKLAQHKLNTMEFVDGDSVIELSKRGTPVDFAYLDSFDFWPDNPGPSQRHQLAEVGAILGKMNKPGLILLDDAGIAHGGKTGLSAPFLEERGWKLMASEYQRIYVQQ